MNSFSFKNVLRLSAFDLKNNRRQIIGWCISIFAIMFMYMILFPTVKDMAQIKIDAMPKELLSLMGMDSFSDMGNFISYFGVVFNLILIAMGIFAATFTANLISREEKTKTIEFLYSLHVSRTEIYVSKLLTAFIAVFLVVISAVISTGVCGFINGGDTFVFMDFIQIVKVSSLSVFFFMAVSMLLSGITTKIGMSVVGSMVVLFCYFIGYLSTLLGEKGEWLSYLSPYELFSPSNALLLENHTLVQMGICFVLMVIFVVSGALFYKRRDFNV